MIAPSRVGDGTDLGLGQTGLSENSICGLGSVMFNRYAAQFAPSLQEHLRDPQQPSIAIVTSQAAQYSALAEFQLEAQQNAVRALAYDVHLPAYMIAENQIEKLGTPKLAILPSPQALGEKAWQALLTYVDAGGNLLVTGPVDRDAHWQIVHRAADLGLPSHVEPLT